MPKKIKYDKMSIFSDFTSIPEDKLKSLSALGVKSFFPIKIWSQKYLKQYLMSIPGTSDNVNLCEKKTRFGKTGILLTLGFVDLPQYKNLLWKHLKRNHTWLKRSQWTHEFCFVTWSRNTIMKWCPCQTTSLGPWSRSWITCHLPPSEWNHTSS